MSGTEPFGNHLLTHRAQDRSNDCIGMTQMNSGFLSCRRGNFSALFALSLPALLVSAGLAVDISRLSAAKNSLQNSVDAAVMAASRMKGDPEDRKVFFQEFLLASAASDPLLRNIVSDFEADLGLNYIETNGTATADVDLTLMHIFQPKTTQVSVQATAYEATDAIEVALVLDNTGSMATNNRIGALRQAATDLVNILAEVKEKNPNRNIRIALVPFVTAVNIGGQGFKWEWIDQTVSASQHGLNFDGVKKLDPKDGGNGNGKCNGKGNGKDDHPGNCQEGQVKPENFASVSGRVNHLDLFAAINVPWKGCVEARPLNVAVDAVPTATAPNTLFVPYFAPDEPDYDHKNKETSYSLADDKKWANESAKLNNSYLADMLKDSDLNGLTDEQKHFKRQKSLAKYRTDNTRLAKGVVETGPKTAGPNRACPTPVVPLTDDFEMLKAEIGKMIEWNGSGTNVAEGLAWGTRVLSPDEPYDQGDPFKHEGTKKVVVLLTDGENTVFGASNTFNKSDYGAYSFLSSNRFDGATTQSAGVTKVNGWVKGNCKMLKDNAVDIYTVVLQADTAGNRALYSYDDGKGCASAPGNYHPTNDVSKLREVFQKIATSVAALHFTH
jgi:Flp pilus assembly protein TadG